jgi:DNA-binding NtrC family response regulator
MSSRSTPPPEGDSGERSFLTAPRVTEPTHVPRIEAVLEVEAGKPSQKRATLDGDVLRIGSHPSNELVVDDRTVSRFHCRISRGARAWRITDTESRNGTKVAGLRVRDADLAMPECRVEIGDSVIVVREAGHKSVPPLGPQVSFGGLYGASAAMRRMYDLLSRVARTDVTVLIEGESGTGKELITAELVRRGPRAGKPFVVVDCGSIAPTVVESELFGHARGSFTGADRQRIGAFEAADGGTVFLDEIGELPLEMQPKLLRVLETGEIRRMGENQLRKVDVRVIAATNRQLEREVNQGRFREDLFFRLSVVTVRVPALRERREDIPLLVDAFLASLEAMDKRHLFTPEVLDVMAKHDWPGNVRELRNFVERRVVFDIGGLGLDGDNVSPKSAPGSVPPGSVPPGSVPPGSAPAAAAGGGLAVDIERPFRQAKDELIDTFERRYLTDLLAWAEGNVSRAARKAKIDRMYLHRLLQHHGLRKSGSLAD